MNKLIGYAAIQVGDQRIALKWGAFAMERFCEISQVGLMDISTLYEMREMDIDGVAQTIPVFHRPYDFAAHLLWAGANYAALIEGKDPYTVWDAYGWLDELGLSSDQLHPVYAAFWESLHGPKNQEPGIKKKGTAKAAKAKN